MKSINSSHTEDIPLPHFELAKLQSFPLIKFYEAKNQDLAMLMLTFSLVYNDFKDYMWFQELFKDELKKIDTNEKTGTLGQLNGMAEHCTRMLIAHFLELLETLEKFSKQKLYDCKEFKRILYYLKKKKKNLPNDWWTLVALANKKDSRDKFYITLTKIRNNGTYHYKNTKCIYQGLKYFTERKGEPGYVSLGNTLEKTRFYFGDPAIQYYHRKTSDEFGAEFWNILSNYTKKVNVLLRFIVEIYLSQILKAI